MRQTARMANAFIAASSAWFSSPAGVFIGCIAGIFLVLIPGILSQSDGSYLHSRTQNEMMFREPWTIRAFLASFSGWIVVFCGSLSLHQMSFYLLLAALLVTMSVFFLLGPNQITFNTQESCYHSINHWASWPPQVRSGNWDDLNGIFVRRISVKSSLFYSISLSWKDGSEWAPRLGRFSKREDAESSADELSQTLNLPRVEAPSQRMKKPQLSKTK